MKKRIMLLAISLMLVLTGCKTTTTTYEDGEKYLLYGKFVVIKTYRDMGSGALHIVYDKDTKVEYYIHNGICPVYNADGTIKVYEGVE